MVKLLRNVADARRECLGLVTVLVDPVAELKRSPCSNTVNLDANDIVRHGLPYVRPF